MAAVQPLPAAGGMAAEAGGRAWVLVDETDVVRGFARALLWGLHREVAELHVLVDQGPELPALARQAACFRTPVSVWAVAGGDLQLGESVALPSESPLDSRAEQFRDLIEAAGAEPVVEWGTLSGEVLGAQVAQVVIDEDGPRLEVGIGRHERATNLLAWGERPPVDVVALVVQAIRDARRTGDLAHPLNQFGRERWLRRTLSLRPLLVGAERIDPVAPPRPFRDPRVPLVAPSLASTERGPMLVACSVGFDPTLVPMAGELHAARHTDGTPLVVALPEHDVHHLTRLAVSQLKMPASIRTVPDDWYVTAGGG